MIGGAGFLDHQPLFNGRNHEGMRSDVAFAREAFNALFCLLRKAQGNSHVLLLCYK